MYAIRSYYGDPKKHREAYFNNNNELIGFNVDILNAIKKLYQLDINIKTEEWNKINQELENGTIDAVAGAHYSGGPDHRFLYSRSIINTELV